MPNSKRKYCDDYVSLGFTSITVSNEEKPQCFLCGKVLAHSSMKPSKLRDHLTSLHPEKASLTPKMFLAMKDVFDSTTSAPKTSPNSKKFIEASYKVAYMIAQEKKPHTIGERLIKPCALAMTGTVCGVASNEQITKIPLSNNVIHSRIVDMSVDVL